MKGTSEKAAKIRSDLWLRLDRMTVHLQLGRWAGDALTLPLSGRQGAWGGRVNSKWWPVHSRGLVRRLFHVREHRPRMEHWCSRIGRSAEGNPGDTLQSSQPVRTVGHDGTRATRGD